MSHVADDKEQCHAIDNDNDEAKFFECSPMIDNLTETAIQCNNRCEKYDETINSVHVRIGSTQLLHPNRIYITI